MPTSSERPPRRVRYRGTHPRRYDQKYKELNPSAYPETFDKVLASGKTPAGSHRPICLKEVMEALRPAPGLVAVDATLGYGGHALEILQRILPGGILIGLDTDPLELPRTEARLREAGFPASALWIHHSNFAGLPKVLAGHELRGADLIFADLGVSSMQLDNPERGFSFKNPGPLDLRMNPLKGCPASLLLPRLDSPTLARLLVENADEPRSVVIANAIIKAQGIRPITTTTQLAGAIRSALPAQLARDEVTLAIRRVFQALRIEVNDEFSALETFLRVLPTTLNPGGRVVILSFHSGEDRRVKQSFSSGLRSGAYSEVSETIIRPSSAEVASNPRAASAKLRWAIRAETRSSNSQ